VLNDLEAEAIEIIREAVATAANPVMMYSVGKDSSVMLHLAQKACWPAPLPFPLLHIDTTWKFREMIEFRDQVARTRGLRMLVHRNQAALDEGINCQDHGADQHTERLKTEALRQALDQHQFDMVLGGARRDEERSRAKERIFSLRASGHRWDPRSQRPEPWNLFNTLMAPGQSIRVFPLSNWTEVDVWQYILEQRIAVVPLYLARERPVVNRGGQWIVADDARLRLLPGERPQMRRVRFRTLGCYPLTAAIESDAASVEAVLEETRLARNSERQGRLIDHDGAASMERKKREGYF
jgi:sulfate adenylyltransferase subunit 2